MLLALVEQVNVPPLFTVTDKATQEVLSSVTVCVFSMVTVSALVGATPPTHVPPTLQLPVAAEAIAAIYRPHFMTAITVMQIIARRIIA